ncbi:hypothetical protein Bca52824_022700 [Brassica carinata]|uniref:Uncharacterized protein n=1 Tax=Brassica carinata TaxID=52824 RepID=A0A8X7VH76_BRACI|nr:hypothetical protein Bca52824_022700 [Brassica carinata]
MESFALHSLSTTVSFSHHHPSCLSLLCRISSRSPPPTISLPSLLTIQSHSVQPLTFLLFKRIPHFSPTRIAAASRRPSSSTTFLNVLSTAARSETNLSDQPVEI